MLRDWMNDYNKKVERYFKYNLENIHYESVDSLLRIRIQNICELSCY